MYLSLLEKHNALQLSVFVFFPIFRSFNGLVNIADDVGENIGGELDSITGGALFLKLFLKTGRK